MQFHPAQVEEPSTKEWGKCACAITCTRMKRRGQNIDEGSTITCESIGTEGIRRYANDAKEEQNAERSNTKHVQMTQGVTFKTPRQAREERNKEGQSKNKRLARQEEKRRKKSLEAAIEKSMRKIFEERRADIEKTDSDEEVEKVVAALTQEEREGDDGDRQ